MDVEQAKKMAAQTAAKSILNHSTIGLGTGSTIQFAIEELCRRIDEEDLKI